MGKTFTDEDKALLAELGVEVEAKKEAGRTPREERIIAGFEEIQRFTDGHGREPQHGEDRDIFERLYAVRLDCIRRQADARTLVEPVDHQGLLAGPATLPDSSGDEPDDDTLLAELGVEPPPVTELRHVRPMAEKRAAAGGIATREHCRDFDSFRPLFEQVQRELDTGLRETRPFGNDARIGQGDFFILGGQKAHIASTGEFFIHEYGYRDARMRVIFDNGTESNMLMRSFQRAMHKDEAGRRITEPAAGPLFASHIAEGDEASGTIYVLRSMSSLPLVAENRDILHKIGVTGGKIEQRIASARLDPTFLMAGVEVVATWELFNINRSRLENLVHRIFDPARLDIEVRDRFGNPVTPREWFLVPLPVIDEAVARIRDGTIAGWRYDPESARLVQRDNHRAGTWGEDAGADAPNGEDAGDGTPG